MFTFNLDLPITFLITALLVLAVNWSGDWSQRLLWAVASAAMLVLVFWVHHAYKHDTIVAVRNFYASLRVTRNPSSYAGAAVLTLANGSIRHGTQLLDSNELRHTPTTYYTSDSGVGLAVRFCCEGRARNIGVIGLGAGTLAAYGRPGDHIRFYEITQPSQLSRKTLSPTSETPPPRSISKKGTPAHRWPGNLHNTSMYWSWTPSPATPSPFTF